MTFQAIWCKIEPVYGIFFTTVQEDEKVALAVLQDSESRQKFASSSVKITNIAKIPSDNLSSIIILAIIQSSSQNSNALDT